MAQKTLVVKLPAREHEALRSKLALGAFEFRTVPHALFSAKGEGVVATLYKSGKLVIQSPDPEAFLAAHTDVELTSVPAAKSADSAGTDPQAARLARVDEPVIGSDESGKGDYFGPLVVCAAYVTPADAAELGEAGVMDSKRLTDKRASLLGAWLRERVPFALKVVAPREYNEIYPRYPSLNPLLAELHAGAIGELMSHPSVLTEGGDAIHVIVDQFGHESLLRDALRGKQVRLDQAHRAEANPAVAAASIIARQEYLACLRELSAECGVDLRKGAGEPVDQAGVALVKERGLAGIGQFAKLHFRNTGKIRAAVER